MFDDLFSNLGTNITVASQRVLHLLRRFLKNLAYLLPMRLMAGEGTVLYSFLLSLLFFVDVLVLLSCVLSCVLNANVKCCGSVMMCSGSGS
jgi:hypothetical protein